MNFLTAGVVPFANFGLGILERYATALISHPEREPNILKKVDRVIADVPGLRAQLLDPEVIHVTCSDNRLIPALSFRYQSTPHSANIVLGDLRLDPDVIDRKLLDSYNDPVPPSALRLDRLLPEGTVHLHYFREGRPDWRTFVALSRFDRAEPPQDEEKMALAVERLNGHAPWDGADTVLWSGGTLLLEGDDRYVVAAARRLPLPFEFLALRS